MHTRWVMLSSYFTGSPTPSRTPCSVHWFPNSQPYTSAYRFPNSHQYTGVLNRKQVRESSIDSTILSSIAVHKQKMPHPAARNMVECQNCGRWDHCICAGIKHAKAKRTGFVYTCIECKKELNCLPILY